MSTPDFFRSRLDQMIDLRHPLAVLSKRLPWASLEAALAPKLARDARPAKQPGGSPALACAPDDQPALSEEQLQPQR